MELEKQLLEQAVNSILHGSTRTVTEDDGSGNLRYREDRVGDLRSELVNVLATKLASTSEFLGLLEKVFTDDVIKRLQEKMLEEASFSSLPWSVRQKVEEKMKDAGVEVKRYKIVAEVIDEE